MAALTVEAVEHADGAISLGVYRGNVFLPFVTVPAERVTQLVAQAVPDEGGTDENPEEVES